MRNRTKFAKQDQVLVSDLGVPFRVLEITVDILVPLHLMLELNVVFLDQAVSLFREF